MGKERYLSVRGADVVLPVHSDARDVDLRSMLLQHLPQR
jgi:hypothetical protein